MQFRHVLRLNRVLFEITLSFDSMKKKRFASKYLAGFIGAFLWVYVLLVAPNTHADPGHLQGYVMQIEMTPATCSLDASKRKQRKCLEGYSLTVMGLVPETSNQDCKTTTSALLSPIQTSVVARLMPDENNRTQLWRSVGGCVPMNASKYFRTIVNFADRLKIPAELTGPISKDVQKSTIRQQFMRLNPSLPANGIRFSCQSARTKPILTEVQVCYQVNGNYTQCASHVVSSCPDEFTIKGSY